MQWMRTPARRLNMWRSTTAGIIVAAFTTCCHSLTRWRQEYNALRCTSQRRALVEMACPSYMRSPLLLGSLTAGVLGNMRGGSNEVRNEVRWLC
mmetsp:Transcript_11862/g.36639  ORF Transcript_11862/g.36639 Transcript_11862/m.36639 type:complete len:94 (-) Transcript_11862:815-1096(-)